MVLTTGSDVLPARWTKHARLPFNRWLDLVIPGPTLLLQDQASIPRALYSVHAALMKVLNDRLTDIDACSPEDERGGGSYEHEKDVRKAFVSPNGYT